MPRLKPKPGRRSARQWVNDTASGHPAITWGSIAAAITFAAGALPLYHVVDDHWQLHEDATRYERHMKISGLYKDLAFINYQKESASDKVYDLNARKKALGPKFGSSDELILNRAVTKLADVVRQRELIEAKIAEATK